MVEENFIHTLVSKNSSLIKNEYGIFIAVPEKLYNKYEGAGLGKVTIDNNTHEIVDMSYDHYAMSQNAQTDTADPDYVGRVISTDTTTTTISAAFSCYSIAVF